MPPLWKYGADAQMPVSGGGTYPAVCGCAGSPFWPFKTKGERILTRGQRDLVQERLEHERERVAARRVGHHRPGGREVRDVERVVHLAERALDIKSEPDVLPERPRPRQPVP